MAASDDYIGKTIAQKYRIEQMIGEGGMGKVYKATQLLLEKQVVLKVLRQALLSDERTVRRFEREARAASRLNHPNSISILDFGRAEDGSLYMAMEYVQGKDLHQILSREWPLPEARTIRIVSQVLSALADAHGAGVVHRDLKPENIMVEQRRGEPDFVKVLDFGIAKILDSSGDDGPALTRAGFVCGTPEYMSPEQARGATLDHRSDLYAVGVILFQLTSGLLPFDSDSAVGFATKHLTEQPPLPTKRRPEARISGAMERLIMKSLAKSPDDRPQTAEQFRAELLAIDKERRAQVTPSRRGSSVNGPSTPRKVTPIDQDATRISAENVTSNPWSVEQTVRAEVARPKVASVAAPRMAEVTAPLSPDGTFAARRTLPGAGSALLFKVLTGVLVLAAVSLAGAWAWEVHQQGQPKPPPPVVITPEAPKAAWDLEVPPGKRSVDEARKLRAQGDEAFTRGQLAAATEAYLRSFEQDPASETALKLGEVYFHQGRLADARGWWSRHLKDSPGSKAAAYIKARSN